MTADAIAQDAPQVAKIGQRLPVSFETPVLMTAQ